MKQWRWQRSLVALLLALALGITLVFIQQIVPSRVHAASGLTISAPTVAYDATTLRNKGLPGGPDNSWGCYSTGGGGITCFSSNAYYDSSTEARNDTFRMAGTGSDPINSITANNISISGLPSACNYANVSHIYHDASGVLLGFVHCERWPNGNGSAFYATIGLAYSTDGGNSWTWKDEVIQHADAYTTTNPQSNEIGGGAYILYTDGGTQYFYVYTQDNCYGCIPGQNNYITVARAAVADVVNAVRNNTALPTFYRYYGGAWNQPAAWLNGHNGAPQAGMFQDVGIRLPGNNAPESIIYDSALGQYVLAVRTYRNSTFQLSLVTSANPLDFNPADGATEYDLSDTTDSVYASFIGDPNNPELATNSDGSFTMYYTQWPHGNQNASLFYVSKRSITLGSGGSGGPVSGNTYAISNNGTGKCLGFSGNNSTDGTYGDEWECNAGPSQVWVPTQQADGTFEIVNHDTNKCLGFSGNNSADGTYADEWECGAGPSQYWSFAVQSNGTYAITNHYTNKCLGFSGNSSTDGTYADEWECGSGPSQYWNFVSQ